MNRRNWFATAVGGIAWLFGVKQTVATLYPAHMVPSRLIGLDTGKGSEAVSLIRNGQQRLFRIVQMPVRWVILKPPASLEGSSFATSQEALDACVAELEREAKEERSRFLQLLHTETLTANEMREFDRLDPWNGGKNHDL